MNGKHKTIALVAIWLGPALACLASGSAWPAWCYVFSFFGTLALSED